MSLTSDGKWEGRGGGGMAWLWLVKFVTGREELCNDWRKCLTLGWVDARVLCDIAKGRVFPGLKCSWEVQHCWVGIASVYLKVLKLLCDK